MRISALIFVVVVLAGCGPVILRHPATGETVRCSYVQLGRERGCIEDFQRQGFERVPD